MNTESLSAEELRDNAQEASRLLKAMANENRLKILCGLCEGEASVGDISLRLDVSQSSLSQHLALLRKDGLVETRRDGQQIFYSLSNGTARRIIEVLYEDFCAS